MKEAIMGMLFLCLYTSVLPQGRPSQAQIDSVFKNLRNSQRVADSIMHSPKMQQMIKDSKAGSGYSTGGARRVDTTSYKLPPRNGGALAALPVKPLSGASLRQYITGVDKKLTAAFGKAYHTPVVNTDKYSPSMVGNAAALAAAMGYLDQAVLLALKSVERSPDDPTLLNNAGAILQKAGAPVPAIVILESALQQQPGNSTVTNNLGQAYLTLGDKKKALGYLQQCVGSCPNHPLANSSLAMLDLDRGDRSSALRHVESSLRGAFTDKAYHLLYQLKQDAVLMDYFKQRYKQPEYFNENKYQLPPQCESVADISKLTARYDAYRAMLEKVKRNFDEEGKEETKLGKDAILQKARSMGAGSYLGNFMPPFMELANAMLMDISLRMSRGDADVIARSQNRYKQRIKELEDEYHQRERDMKSCGARIELANSYMEKMAVETRDYQKEYLRIYKDFYLDNAYWSFFTTFDPHMRRGEFCRLTSSFLSVLQQLAVTHFLPVSLDCAADEKQKGDADEVQVKADCPLGDDGIEIPFIIGKYSLNCERQEIEFGELIIVNVSHKFGTGETILAVGPGVAAHTPELKAGPLQFGVEAGLKGQVFLDFKNGSLMDWGGVFEAELDLKGVAHEFKTGYTLGANSGLQMEEGIVKDLIDDNLGPPKEASQMNKNVKLYKP
ncbi:MAG TPA: tetratricopeptide repeat protein [Puia sp.]|nr:tetratricopeptide repeat protein [Puia sp.]